MNSLSKLEQRFWSKVQKTDSCWNWLGGKNTRGYGHIEVNYKKISAYRLSYQLIKGKIPENKEIDHLCRNHACVNPDHLEAVTHKENVRRGDVSKYNSIKTHCPQGHPYSGDNLYNNNGRRHCKTCGKIKGKIWWDEHKDEVNRQKREQYRMENYGVCN